MDCVPDERISFAMKGPSIFNRFLNSVTIIEKASDKDYVDRVCEMRQVLSTAADVILELQVRLETERSRVTSVMQSGSSIISTFKATSDVTMKLDTAEIGFEYLQMDSVMRPPVPPSFQEK